MSPSKPVKPVLLRVLVRTTDDLYHLWKMSLAPMKGEIYVFPQGRHSTVADSSFVTAGASIDHVSFHIDGKTHVKDKNGGRHDAHYLLPIQKTGFQVLLKDSVTDYKASLETTDEPEERDVVLELGDHLDEGFAVNLSIISGRLIAAGTARTNRTGEGGLINIERRGLGWESGNADKMLQFALYELPEELPRPRRFFLPQPAGIARPEY